MSKEIERIFEAYVCNPDVYEYAYEHCNEYRKYIDSLPEKSKSAISRAHTGYKIANGSNRVREGLFHAATFGLSYGIKKLATRNSKSKQERIAEIVNSEEFINIFRTLNSKGE